MFRLLDKDIQFPALYPKVERELPTAKSKGWTKVGGFLLRDKVDFIPQPGLQENVCACEANVIHMCGAATMGKSFTGILLWGYRVDKKGASGAMISTRLQDSKKGSSIFRDNELVWGQYAGCQYNTSDYPTFAWPQWFSAWRLIHSNFNTDNPAEWSAFVEYAKKNQNGYQYFDEANDLPEKQYHYWNSRNRDDSGVPPQSVYSYNPPGKSHYFTRNLINGGYVGADLWFKPEMNGVVRYYYAPSDNVDDFIWGDTPEEVAKAAGIVLTEKDRAAGLSETDMIRSFAAFTGEASDNRMLVASTGGKSVANLLYSGQGAVLKDGYFGDIKEDENNVSKNMITRLWENPKDEDENMYATFDVGGGKGDSAPLIIWRGLQMIAIEYFADEPEELSRWIQSRLSRYGVPVEHFAYDGTGFGFWLQGLTNGISVTANRRTVQEYDEYGNQVTRDEFFNLRSQLLGKLEVYLKRGDISCVIDRNMHVKFGTKNDTRRFIDVLYDGVSLFIITKKNGKTYYNSKDEFKARFKYSPGELDAMMLRMIFELDTRERKQPSPQVADDAYDEIYQGADRRWGSRRIFAHY